MMIRVRHSAEGEHVHATMWAGPDPTHLAHAGKIVLRTDEWAILRGVLEGGNGHGGATVEVLPARRLG